MRENIYVIYIKKTILSKKHWLLAIFDRISNKSDRLKDEKIVNLGQTELFSCCKLEPNI